MDLLPLVDNMSEEMYLRLKCAAETGKWPEGTVVDQAQKDSALQISMAYQSRHLNSDEILSVGADGEIVTKSKRELKTQFKKAVVEQQTAEQQNEAEHNTIARFTQL